MPNALHNGRIEAVVNVVVAPDPLLSGPLSPELVLVSPPEVARLARSLLSPPPTVRPAPARAPAVLEASPGAIELAAVWLLCLVMTIGPLVFLLAQT
jgi:hypothetical protein